jgi:hypothetical protein
MLGQAIRKQYLDLGHQVVPKDVADMFVVNGDVEETEDGRNLVEGSRLEEIIFLTLLGHDPHPEVLLRRS